MNEYYKEAHQQYADRLAKENKNFAHKSLSQLSKDEVEQDLKQFIDHIFGADLLNSSELTAD